jgi:predicted outer membrane repeat protein
MQARTQVAGMMGAAISITGNSIITKCITNNDGGAVYVNESSTLAVSGNVRVSDNSAGNKGGALYAEGAAVNLEGACKLQNVGLFIYFNFLFYFLFYFFNLFYLLATECGSFIY